MPENAEANLAALAGAYGRWSATKGGNVDEILDLFAPEVEMRSVLVPEVPSELAGTHKTRAQAAAYFESLTADWEMLNYDVDRFIVGADGKDIVMVGRMGWRHKATGNEIRSPKVDIWRFENGRATGFFELFDSLGFAQAVGAVALTA